MAGARAVALVELLGRLLFIPLLGGELVLQLAGGDVVGEG